jgi:radical SAM protein with 4Fe4S-binding SPASM domain
LWISLDFLTNNFDKKSFNQQNTSNTGEFYLKANLGFVIMGINMNNKSFSQVRSLAFRITDLCNLSCKFCGQAKQKLSEKQKKEHYLELDLLKKAVLDVYEFKPQIYIWGGEPLIYPQLKEFLIFIRELKLNTFITTNGVLLNKFSKLLVDLKVTEITVSLEGKKEIHESARGLSNIYGKIINNLTELNEIKKVNNKVFPIIDINTVIFENNYRYLYDFCCYILDMNFVRTIRLQFPMFFNESMCNEFSNHVEKTFGYKDGTSWKYFIDDYKKIDLAILDKEIKKCKTLKRVQVFPDIDNPSEWFNNPELRFKETCNAIYKRINIEPGGNVISCCDFPETVYGNIKNDNLRSLFSNKTITKKREELKKKKLQLCNRCSYLYIY